MKYILNIFVILSLGIFCCCGGEKLTYEVVYNTNGGIWNKNFVPKTVSKTSKKISLPSNKEINRNGYIFCGWYSTELFESGTEIKDSISYKNTKRINLYAKWDLINYTINYNLNGGENSKANPVNYNVESESIILADGKRFGYDFCGWYKDKDFKEDSRIVKIIKGSAENVELFAKWGKIGEEDVSQNGKVKVTLNWNPNVKVNNVNCFLYNFETKMVEKTHKNKKISLKKDKVIYSEEEIPLGVYAVKIELYNIDNVLLNTFADIVYIEKNKISLKEEMLINLNEIYAINYNTNGGSWKKGFIPEIKRNVNTSVLLPTERDIGKSGGVFRGWYTTERFDTETKIAYISLGLAKNIELYAKWDLINYAINYNLNGGENSKVNPVNYNVADNSIVLKEAERVGYTFAGWYRSADFSGDKVTEIVQGNTGNIDLYAKWDLINYTINYNLNGGENSKANPVNYNVTDKSIVLKEAIRDGYTFTGWYRSADFSGDKVREIVQGNTGNIDLYAKWDLINYTINYNLNGGENSKANPVNYNVADNSIVLKEAERVGYTFAGWYRSADFSGDKVTEIAQGNTGNIDLYAKWNANIYIVTLDDNESLKIAATYESVLPNIAVPHKKKGYDFKGYYFTDSNGKEYQYYNEKCVGVANWNIVGDGKLYAKWQLANYTINYNLNGGENLETNLKNYNIATESIVLKNAKRTGCTFAGWYRNADFSGDKVTEIAQGNTGNIELYAKWDLINYTINYNLNGGKNVSVNPISYNVENKCIKLKNPRRSGALFLGWYKTADFSDNKIKFINNEISDIELYAKWYLINYKLIIIIICVLIVIVFICVLSYKLLVDSKINKFVKKVIDNNYNLKRLDVALNWKPSGKNEEIDRENKIKVNEVINNYSENEIAVYKKYKNKISSRVNECESKKEKEREKDEKNKKNIEYVKDEILDAIKVIVNQITNIGESIEEDKDLDIKMGLKDISDSLDILIKNKKHIKQYEKETNIKNLNEQFNHLCNKYKDMQGSQDNLNGVKMNQIRKKFKKILK